MSWWYHCPSPDISKNKIEIKSFIDYFLSKKEFRIILTGAGTSAFAGEVCEPYLTSLLNKRVEAIATTDLVASPKSYFIKDIPTLLEKEMEIHYVY